MRSSLFHDEHHQSRNDDVSSKTEAILQIMQNGGDGGDSLVATTTTTTTALPSPSLSLSLPTTIHCNNNTQDDNNDKKRRHRRRSTNSTNKSFILSYSRPSLAVTLTIICWFCTLLYSHYRLSNIENRQLFVLEEEEEENSTMEDERFFQEEHKTISELSSTKSDLGNNNAQQHSTTTTENKSFLIFEGERLKGQGAGNLMNGLLSSHLLGEEFNRTVCVIPDWYSFHKAFELKDVTTRELCNKFFEENPVDEENLEYEKRIDENEINLINFKMPPDECILKETLASKEKSVLYVQSNTYPRWREVPPNFFHQFYQAKPELLDLLPYNVNNPPSTVVHLRLEDCLLDKRKGLDQASLEALGNLLKSSSTVKEEEQQQHPYLVTNHVQWFEYFEKTFQWTHPTWNSVKHSALDVDWSTVAKITINGARQEEQEKISQEKQKEEKQRQMMMLWADWYSLLTAKKVYHTFSDFSNSAIHWMGNNPETHESIIWSRTILGVNTDTNELELSKEAWNVDPPMPRVVDREGEDLKNCRKNRYDYQKSNEKLAAELGIDLERSTMNRRNLRQYELWKKAQYSSKLNVDPSIIEEKLKDMVNSFAKHEEQETS